MKRSLALRILLVASAAGVMFAPGSLSAQDAPSLLEAPLLLEAPGPVEASAPTLDAARFSPATLAAAVDDERPPLREPATSLRVDEQRRRVRRVRVRGALIATAVLTGIVAASVGVSKLLPETREPEPERDGDELLGWLLLLGAL